VSAWHRECVSGVRQGVERMTAGIRLSTGLWAGAMLIAASLAGMLAGGATF